MTRLATLFAAILLLAVAARAPAFAQVLEVATDQSPVGLDPHVTPAFSTQLITSAIYEGLTAIDPALAVVPALAESWTISDDGLRYVFRLRAATFHDGRPVTPADVIGSIARVKDPKTASPFASRFADVDEAEADGERGVAVTLDAPSAPFLSQLANLVIVPANQAELGRRPMGTGPFRFREWIPDTAIVLERNPAYWAPGLPKLAGVRFNIVPESATRQIGLQGGTYRMLPSLDAATATALEGQAGVRVLGVQDLAYSVVGLNASRPPFDKPEAREAVNFAIDRAQVIAAAYFGKAAPAGPLSPALKDWALPVTDFPCYKPDPARAKALLQQAGLTPPVKVTLNVLGSLAVVVDIAQIVQAQMNQAGFEVALNVQEQGRFIQDWRGGNFQAFASLNGGGPDPDDYLGRTFQTGGATNVFKFSDVAVDKLLVDGRATTDAVKRRAIYADAQLALACRGPAVHVAYGTLFTAIRTDLRDYAPNPTRSLRGLRDARVGN